MFVVLAAVLWFIGYLAVCIALLSQVIQAALWLIQYIKYDVFVHVGGWEWTWANIWLFIGGIACFLIAIVIGGSRASRSLR